MSDPYVTVRKSEIDGMKADIKYLESLTKAKILGLYDVNSYQKIPVAVEAVKWSGYFSSEYPHNMHTVHNFTGGKAALNSESDLMLETLEGSERVDVGSWIIKGLAPEFYTCGSSVFEDTYELVEEVDTDWAHLLA